jgi:hypothetical protein
LFRVPTDYAKEESPRSRAARDSRDAAPAEISGGGFNRR